MAAALYKEDMRCVHVIVLLSFIKLSIILLISVLNAIGAQIVLTCIIPTSNSRSTSRKVSHGINELIGKIAPLVELLRIFWTEVLRKNPPPSGLLLREFKK